MPNRSLEAWKSWRDAHLKYEYYITGLTAALFAYVGSKYVPQKLAFSQNTLELIAIIFLGVALIIGIRRLEIDVSFQTVMLKDAEAKEMRDEANKIAALGGSKNLDTGGTITVEEAKARAKKMQSSIELINEIFNSKSLYLMWLYKIRSWSLMLGFATLIASKIIGVYKI